MWQLKRRAYETKWALSLLSFVVRWEIRDENTQTIWLQVTRVKGNSCSQRGALFYRCDDWRRAALKNAYISTYAWHLQMLHGNWLRLKIRNSSLKVREEKRQRCSFIKPLRQPALSSYARALMWFIKHLYLASFSVGMTEHWWMWLLKTSSFNDVWNFLWWCSKVPPLIQV